MDAYRVLTIGGLAVLSASVAVAADDGPRKLFPDEGRKNPYAKLFSASSIAAQQRRPMTQEVEVPRPARPRVVCGMLVIPVDAGIDPHMRQSPPEGDDTTYTIRAIEPPICWQK